MRDDDPVAEFGCDVDDDVRRYQRALGGRGRYAAGPDPVQVARIADSLRSVEPTEDIVSAILTARPAQRGGGIDWGALGRDRPPLLLTAADPVMAFLRATEPPPQRPWRVTARPDQLPPPGDWLDWLIMAGRGWGKTFTGANALAEMALAERGDYAVIAPTFGDARKILVEGPSGLIKALGDDLVSYNKSDYILTLSNGSRVVLASADAPDRLRGWNLSGAWLDELASYRDLMVLWDEALMPALRIGRLPRKIITTTPRRGNKVLKDLIKRHKDGDSSVVVTRGSTMDNAANLSPVVLEALQRRYAGTSLGRQELEGELLEDVEGSLIKTALIESTRILDIDDMPELYRIVVGVDPSVTEDGGGDRCGIVVVGLGPPPRGFTAKVTGDHLYWLEDASVNASPEKWARRVLEVADEWSADAIVAENNNGRALVESMIRLVARAERRRIPNIIPVWASVGKRTRAEPVAGVWEQRRAHVVGTWPEYEDYWSGWVPSSGKSPDELDAGVWGAVDLMPELATKALTEVRIIA